MTIEQTEDTMTAEAETPTEGTPPVEGKRRAKRRPWQQWGLLAVALAAAASGLFAWSNASGDKTVALAENRDTVLISARQNIETLNSLDYRKVDQGLKAWSAVTTGALHDQLVDVDKENRTLLADQKKISTGKVVDAAVIDLDSRTATVIAAVEITVEDAAKPGSTPTVKRNRFSADLVKVKGKWKLENLQQVAVNLS